MVYPTIPRLYTAAAQWMGCMLFVLVLTKQRRFRGLKLAVISGTELVALCLELQLTDGLQAHWWILAMLGAAVIMQLFLGAALVLPWQSVFYCFGRAFLLSELATSLTWQIYYFAYLNWLGMEDSMLGENIFALVIYLLVFGIAYMIERRYNDDGYCAPIRGKDLAMALFIALSVFVLSNLSFIAENTPFSGQNLRDIYYIRTLVDLGGLILLYAYHIQCRELRLRFETATIQSMMNSQYQQYQQTLDNMDLINRKYHDLKHQIAYLRAEEDSGRRKDWLDAMEKEISAFETQNKTGNSVLDTLLMDKGFYCQKNDISLTCVADGSLLNFMAVTDICAIFGNALDNAIESVLQIPEKEKKLIHLSVSRQKDFLLIKIENYFEGDLQFEDRLPISTKADKNIHGYGIRSIRYSTQRYGGIMNLSAENHWFELKILIPLQPEG